MPRTIEWGGRFARDYKREKRGRHRATVDDVLQEVLNALVDDRRLDAHYRDHALSGNWRDHRDCHLKPDLVLIYRLPDPDTFQLVRLGSHAELGL